MKKIFITGISGTGKTTAAKELDQRGFYAISIDEVEGLCSWIDQETGENHGGKFTKLDMEFVDRHDWICDIEHLEKLMNKDTDTVFVLGMATNQYDFLHLFDKIFLLECSPETFCKRIDERTDNDFGKDEEIKKRILGRYETYAARMKSLGAVSISTEKPIIEVVDEIILKTSQ
jgi:broad-specificity NMP kinase